MHYAERKKPDSNDDIWFDSYSILKMAELQKEKKNDQWIRGRNWVCLERNTKNFFLVRAGDSDGTFPDCAGGYTIVCICQNPELYIKRDAFRHVNYTSTNLTLKTKRGKDRSAWVLSKAEGTSQTWNSGSFFFFFLVLISLSRYYCTVMQNFNFLIHSYIT